MIAQAQGPWTSLALHTLGDVTRRSEYPDPKLEAKLVGLTTFAVADYSWDADGWDADGWDTDGWRSHAASDTIQFRLRKFDDRTAAGIDWLIGRGRGAVVRLGLAHDDLSIKMGPIFQGASDDEPSAHSFRSAIGLKPS